jgi:hypothetical protein
MWNIETKQEISALREHGHWARSVAFSPYMGNVCSPGLPIKIPIERPEAVIMHVRPQNRRGDARHPSHALAETVIMQQIHSLAQHRSQASCFFPWAQ